MSDRLIYAIGDIHGMDVQLRALLRKIRKDAAGRPYKLIFLGDYIDRGPSSAGVVELVRRIAGGEWPFPDGAPATVIALKGNHEVMLESAIETGTSLSNVSSWWLGHGGRETMASYGWEAAKPFTIPIDHLDFIRAMPLFHETDDLFFVHSGCSPGQNLDWHKEGGDDREAILLWTRAGFIDSDHDWGKRIVHGHTISWDPDVRPNRIGIDTGCYDTGVLTAACFHPGVAPTFIQVEGDPALAR